MRPSELDQLILLESTPKATRNPLTNVKRITWGIVSDIEPALSYDLPPFPPDAVTPTPPPPPKNGDLPSKAHLPTPGPPQAPAPSASAAKNKKKKKKKKASATATAVQESDEDDLPDLEPVSQKRQGAAPSKGPSTSPTSPTRPTTKNASKVRLFW